MAKRGARSSNKSNKKILVWTVVIVLIILAVVVFIRVKYSETPLFSPVSLARPGKCTDSDGGGFYSQNAPGELTIKFGVSFFGGDGGTLIGLPKTVSIKDTCKDASTVTEYSCSANPNGGFAALETNYDKTDVPCTPEQECALDLYGRGFCLKKEAKYCTDTDNPQSSGGPEVKIFNSAPQSPIGATNYFDVPNIKGSAESNYGGSGIGCVQYSMTQDGTISASGPRIICSDSCAADVDSSGISHGIYEYYCEKNGGPMASKKYDFSCLNGETLL